MRVVSLSGAGHDNGKRERAAGTDKSCVRRDEEGRFNESDDQGRFLSQDVKRKAKTEEARRRGDKGD